MRMAVLVLLLIITALVPNVTSSALPPNCDPNQPEVSLTVIVSESNISWEVIMTNSPKFTDDYFQWISIQRKSNFHYYP